jgi:HAD superfamily hydrolase (TIGR01484 family)
MPEKLLLCTDLDRTLIPNGPQPESMGARDHFATLASDARVVLTYVTGRHRQLVEEAIVQYRLPRPGFVIGDVGTTIYRLQSDADWQLVKTWEQKISLDWKGMTHSDLRPMLDDIGELRLQEPGKQNLHKLSYYVSLGCDQVALECAVTQRLQAQAIRARLVWSVDEPAAIGLLDVLPESASKYHALACLQDLLHFTDNNTVFSGDSGNDIEVLASSVPAILVANSESTVRAKALREAAAAHHSAQLYIASGGLNGMNGNYSAGILEGIAHYHPQVVSWMGLETAI